MSWSGNYALTPDDALGQAWHKRYYESGIVGRTSFLGVPIGKYPSDLLVYANLLHATRPDLLIETGTNAGGSAYYFATIMDALGHGRVLTIDPFDRQDGVPRPAHPRITYLQASSIDPWTVTLVAAQARGKRTMVVLDSIHAGEYVYQELRAYCPFVTDGQYLICEDTNLNGHPVAPSHGPGPMEAVQAFLSQTSDFEVDRECERFAVTANPNGWLRRVQGRPLHG
jgi:cephalosporin hydroxylase